MLRLKYLRLTKELSQKKVEDDLHINHHTLSAIENGRLTKPYDSIITKLEEYFQCPRDMLLRPVSDEEEMRGISLQNKKRKEAARHGGIATSLLYGRLHMQKIGKEGNRVNNPTRPVRRRIQSA